MSVLIETMVDTSPDVPSLFQIIKYNVDFYFSDAHEIGSSDVSVCVNSVIRDYAPQTDNYASVPTRREIRRSVQEAISLLGDDW
tara:strand:+ start:187 stop:438 length:252 start_codon:yes stop_codon:yes gene_type:complete